MASVYGSVPKGTAVWDFITEKRRPFMDAARAELGITPDG
jgi:hypothetical protein